MPKSSNRETNTFLTVPCNLRYQRKPVTVDKHITHINHHGEITWYRSAHWLNLKERKTRFSKGRRVRS